MQNGFKVRLVLLIGVSMFVGSLVNVPTIAYAQQEGLWSRIYNSLFGTKPPVPTVPGGSRPVMKSSLCSVIPGQWGTEQPLLMLRSRPTWVWRGTVDFVKLEKAGQVVWEQPVSLSPDADGLTRMVYSGPDLEAGQKYRLIMSRRSTIPSEIYANFQTVSPEAKSQLSFQQQQVRESAWRSGKRGLAMVQEQVSFLTQQGLWLDLTQEILASTEEITPEWRKVQAGIVYETCDKPSEKANPLTYMFRHARFNSSL
ncbi:hypothetical protein ACN4EG_23085 [Alkalinema pantanalense CENA528]|uniref:hypothetical protein n=1 Tax=Alkalinema pantanalense TaxID=1620705 RepID=UPI003D6F5630